RLTGLFSSFTHLLIYSFANSFKFGFALVVVSFCQMLTFSVKEQIVPSTQTEKTDTRNGNKQFDKENYTDAEADYKKAIEKKNNMPEAVFNMGDAVYEQ